MPILDPTATEVFGLPIYWYGLSFIASFVLLRVQFLRISRIQVAFVNSRSSIGELDLLFLGLATAAVAGGRLWHELFSHQSINHSTGISSMGAIIASAAALAGYCRCRKLSFLLMADAMVLAAPVGVILVRFTNLITHSESANFPTLQFTEIFLQGFLPFLIFLPFLVAPRTMPHGLATLVFAICYLLSKIAIAVLGSGAPKPTLMFAAVSVVLIAAFLYVNQNQRPGRKMSSGEFLPPPPFGALHILGTIIFCILLAPLAGCSSPPVDQIPSYPPQPKITLSNPNAEARCACHNSQGAYWINPTNAQRTVRWRVDTVDTSSPKPVELAPISGGPLTLAANSGQTFIGCTIHATNSVPTCRFQARYSEISLSAQRSSSASSAAIFGEPPIPSVSTCQTWCSDPTNPNNGPCLSLGVRYFKGIAPLAKAIEKASQVATAEIKMPDLLAEYGMKDTDDQCGRGNIFISNGVVTNSSKTASERTCTIKSQDLPTQVASALGVLSKDGRSQFSMNTVLQNKVEGTLAPNVSALNATNILLFDLVRFAPAITFEGPGALEMGNTFGGPVSAVARIAVPGKIPQTVLATMNGCIAIDEAVR